MTTETSPISISSEDYQQILESIGYNLLDFGDHWRTKALYRSGDNTTAVKIYKNTGVWMDFIENRGCKPFESLLRLSVKDNEKVNSLLKGVKNKNSTPYIKKEKIEMEKVYHEKCLEKLFPNYNFYNQRKISNSTQASFQVGLAGIGKMYRRLVFPIYNENGQIIGFSGRKIDEDNDYPKWKQIGKKNNWVYPANIPNHDCNDEIELKKEVILVESIGDALALYENGVKNVLVIFGLNASSAITNYLSSKILDRIIISTNNDARSSENRGMIAAIKNYLNLSNYFDLDKLLIKFPPKGANDFGEAHENDYNIINWHDKQVDQIEQRRYIVDYVQNNRSAFSQKHIKQAKRINA